MMNRSILVGRVVRDPELRKTNSGTSVVTFTVALDNRVRAGGEKSTSFIPVTAWSQTAENVSKYVRKGSLVGVDGRLNQRSYNSSDGRKVSVIEVIADSVTFLEKRQDVVQNEPIEHPFDLNSEPESQNGIDVTTDNDLPF